jgi:hypothetical protein
LFPENFWIITEVHRLHDLMNPNHQPQAVEDDVGFVVVPSREDSEEVEPILESWEEASMSSVRVYCTSGLRAVAA